MNDNGEIMLRTIVFSAIFLLLPLGQGAENPPSTEPQFTKDNELVRPENYREWIFLTSGSGMTYAESPVAAEHPNFDNVFVRPESYRAFLATGKWPEKTMFILEIRASTSHGSINKGGHYQKDVVAIEAEVKDASRFADKWAYFGFGRGDKLTATAKAFPAGNNCLSCHSKNAAVENTFVQFYPTLWKVAEAKGTINKGFVDQGR
jgi:Cytochrome P460